MYTRNPRAVMSRAIGAAGAANGPRPNASSAGAKSRSVHATGGLACSFGQIVW
jgi:hypothetical protein